MLLSHRPHSIHSYSQLKRYYQSHALAPVITFTLDFFSEQSNIEYYNFAREKLVIIPFSVIAIEVIDIAIFIKGEISSDV